MAEGAADVQKQPNPPRGGLKTVAEEGTFDAERVSEMGMEIRAATVEDVVAMSRIHACSWKSAYRGIVPQEYLDELREDFWVPCFETGLKAGLLRAQILLEEGCAVGCASYGKARDSSLPEWGEVLSLYLLPESCGRGYGHKLLDGVLLDLKGSGYPSVYLWVLEQNSRARRFYERNGWQNHRDEWVCKILGQELKELRYALSFDGSCR